MLEIIPVEKIKEEPENASIETVITLDDDTPQEIVFIKEEPYIETCLVAKVKAESTTLDTAVIWPTSPSEEAESEETVRIIQKIIALSCKQEPDDEITVVSEIFRGSNQEFRLEETCNLSEKSQDCDQTSFVSDGFRGWSMTPDLSKKFKEWYKNQIQGLNEGVATSSIESPGNGSVIQDATSCSNYTHLKEKVTSLEDVIVSNTVHTNIGNYVCCKCKRISGADVSASNSNSGEDKFHCGVCSYMCSSSEDLKTHMRTHRDQNIGPVSFIEKDVSTTENLQCSQDLICNNNETDETLENNNIVGKNYKAGPLKKKITSDKSTSVSVIPEFNSVAKQSGSIKKIYKFDNTTTSSNKTSALKFDHKLKLYPVVVLDVIPKNVLRNDNHTIRKEEINGSNKSNETREAIDCKNEEFCSTSKDNSKTGETVDDDQQNHTEKLTNKVSVEGDNANPNKVGVKRKLLEESTSTVLYGNANSNKVGVKRKLLEESTSTVLYVNANSNKVGVKRKLLEESTSTVLYVNGKCNTEEYRQQKISRCSVNKYRCQVCVFKTASKQCIEEHKKIHLPKKYKKKSKKRSRLTSVAKVSDSVSSVNTKLVETTDTSVSSVNTKVVETTDTVVPSDKTMDHNKSEKQKLLDILETRDSSTSVPPENQVIKTNERNKGLENYKIPKLSGKKVLHKCVLCNFESTHENLIKHARVHKSKPKQTDKDSAKVERRPRQIYKCAECDYSSRSFRNLKFHEYIHSGEKPFSCKLCTYKCRRPENILPHMRMHYKDKPFKCSICGDKFTQSGSLKSHMRTHNGEKPYECDYCDYTCARISNLKYHMDTHSGIKPFKCNICGYKCSRSYSLKTHMRRHTGERPYKCTMCSHSAKNSSGLKVHMYTHTNYKPLKCKMCTYATPNPLTLEMHIRTHTGEKPYQCTECDFKTSRPSCLKTHVRIHTGEKPYVCSICQFACARYGNLVCHIRTHTGQRPYECGTCSTKFTTKSALTIHTRIHTGEKPYKCTLCVYASYAAGELKKHVRRKHFNVDTTTA